MAAARRRRAKRVTATKAQRSLSELLSRVSYGGEEFIIERSGRPVAKLGPASRTKIPAAERPSCTAAEFVDRLERLRWPDEFVRIMLRLRKEQPRTPAAPRFD